MAWNWAGTDIGKAHHHTVVLNNDGEVLLSRKVVNDEADPTAWLPCWSTSCSTMDRPSSICPASP